MGGPGIRALALAAAIAVCVGCGTAVEGTATWPGARLERSVLGAADFPPGVEYDVVENAPAESDGPGGPPAMLSEPSGCANGLTEVIAASAERGPGSAVRYVVAYDGARILVTVLSWPLDLDGLAAEADRCGDFQAFFDSTSPGIPMTTTALAAPRPDTLTYRQTMRLAAPRAASTSGSATSGRRRSSPWRSRPPIRRSTSKPSCRKRLWRSPPSRPTAWSTA